MFSSKTSPGDRGGTTCFRQFAGGASLFRGLFRLLFEFDAFQAQQIFGALESDLSGCGKRR